MSSNMPPVPPGNRSDKGPRKTSKKDEEASSKLAEDKSVKGSEKHHNAAEEGDTANIKQNTTNKGFYRGRRMG
ncbi:MAG: hypothetical protein WAL80_08730 [Xanthobacteraceae bacterium]|jgi:hypothetical protein